VKKPYIGKDMLTGPFNISPPSIFAGSSPCADFGLGVLPLALGLGAEDPAGDATAAEVVAGEPAREAGPGLGLAVAEPETGLEVDGVEVVLA